MLLRPLVFVVFCCNYMCACYKKACEIKPYTMERPAKLTRLQALRSRLPAISQAAFASVLQHTHGEVDLPRANRRDVRDARDTLCTRATPYGPVHQVITVGGVQLEIQNPFAMLHSACSGSAALSGVVRRACQRSPPSAGMPWSSARARCAFKGTANSFVFLRGGRGF